MSEDKSSNAQELIQEEEAVNARYYVASCDQRDQNEKDSEQLHCVVCEEEQKNDEEASTDVNPMVLILNIIASSRGNAVVILLHVEEVNT